MAHTPPELLRHVPLSFPHAVQIVAALEARIAYLRDVGADGWAIVDAHAALALTREAFGLWPEAALDAAHEAAVADLEDLRVRDGLPDVPLAAPGELMKAWGK
jgi:hypothetical protein